jgi:hypothetical protein
MNQVDACCCEDRYSPHHHGHLAPPPHHHHLDPHDRDGCCRCAFPTLYLLLQLPTSYPSYLSYHQQYLLSSVQQVLQQ